MEAEEIINQRKDKFLSIGRSKGFTSQSEISKNLSMQENLIEKFKLKFKNNIYAIYSFILILIIIIISLIIL